MDWFQGSIGKVYGVFGKYEAAALRAARRPYGLPEHETFGTGRSWNLKLGTE